MPWGNKALTSALTRLGRSLSAARKLLMWGLSVSGSTRTVWLSTMASLRSSASSCLRVRSLSRSSLATDSDSLP